VDPAPEGGRRVKWGPILLLGILAWGVLFYLRTWDQKLLLGDEGVALLGAVRVLQGDVPNHDFFEIIPPVSFLPTAGLFALCGVSVSAGRLIPLLLEGLILGGVLVLLARLGAAWPPRLFAAALLIPMGVAYWPVASHHWWADAFQLWALVALLPDPEGGHPPVRLFLGGLLSGLGLLTLQDQGGYFLLGLGIFYFPFGERRLRRVAHFTSGFLAGTLPVALWLLPGVSIGDLWYAWVVFPLTRYHTLPGHAFGLMSGWRQIVDLFPGGRWIGAPLYSLSLLACGALLFLLPFAALGGLAWTWRRKLQPGPVLGLLAAGTLAFLGAAAHRWALTNAVWAAPMFLVAAGATAGLRGGLARSSRWRNGIFTAAAGFALLFGATFYRLAAPSATAAVSSRAGTLRTLAGGDAAALQEALDAVETYVPEGAPMFPLGFIGLVNVLAERPNPTRFHVMIRPWYNTEEQARTAVEDLRRVPVQWIVGPARGKLPARDPITVEIEERYGAVWGNGRYTLWERKPPEIDAGRP